MAETIGIISIKGGVGKTTTAVNLACVMANEFKKKVLLIDGNFSAPNVGLHLGIVDPEATIHDVINNKLLASEVIHNHQYNFDVILGSITTLHKNSQIKLKEKLKGLQKRYDIIILDSSPTLNHEMLAVMQASDKLLAVTTPDPLTVKMTAHATRVAKEKNIPIMGIVLNKWKNRKYEVSIENIEKKSKAPVLATITDHLKVLESLAKIIPVTINYPHSKTSREFKALAAAILDEKYKEPSLWAKAKNYITEDYTNLKSHDFKKSMAYYK